jgi:hypothetical protein
MALEFDMYNFHAPMRTDEVPLMPEVIMEAPPLQPTIEEAKEEKLEPNWMSEFVDRREVVQPDDIDFIDNLDFFYQPPQE